MRWELTSKEKKQEVYQLFNEGRSLVTLSINSFSRTARVECGTEKRIFQISKEGFLRNKVVIKNEYGVSLGESGQENKLHFFDITGERFFYTLNKELSEFVLFKDSVTKPLLTCSLVVKDTDTSVIISEDQGQMDIAPHPELLMAIGWYLFLPHVKENAVALVS
jgi:hypothetical protein